MLYLEIKQTPKMGNGVYATKYFARGETIEICPVVPLSSKETRIVGETRLDYWLFEWHKKLSAMLFGYGMIYNHSQNPNASYHYDYKQNLVKFKCIKSIRKGKQIFINYNQYGHHDNNHISMFHPKTKKYFKLKPPQATNN